MRRKFSKRIPSYFTRYVAKRTRLSVQRGGYGRHLPTYTVQIVIRYVEFRFDPQLAANGLSRAQPGPLAVADLVEPASRVPSRSRAPESALG